jgi:hypothetical protein
VFDVNIMVTEFDVQTRVEPRPTVIRSLTLRLFQLVLVAPLVAAALMGCRGRAQQDLYQAKMSHEIRVLEDELYEADYHNRVLIDKLEQIRLKSAPASPSLPSPSLKSPSYESIPTPVPRPQKVPAQEQDAKSTFPGESTPADLMPPEVPEINIPGANQRRRAEDLEDLGDIVDEGQRFDPSELPGSAPARVPSDSPAELLPAPGGPEPPGKRDTDIPPVLPGEILPPSELDQQNDKPPGQIILPDSANDRRGVPDQLRLHSSLSGGKRVDGNVEDMRIVVNVLDQDGRPLDLEAFKVEAELSVVLFEVDQDEVDDARIGRWDFTAEQVGELVRTEPISGLHVPISWQGRQPEGDEIVVHVRLRSEEDEMRCEGRLKVERANAVAQWAPRGDSRK